MKKGHISQVSIIALLCMLSMTALSSCAGFKLVSQRPSTGNAASVDANSGATSPAEAPAQDGGASPDPKATDTSTDAVSAATS